MIGEVTDAPWGVHVQLSRFRWSVFSCRAQSYFVLNWSQQKVQQNLRPDLALLLLRTRPVDRLFDVVVESCDLLEVLDLTDAVDGCEETLGALLCELTVDTGRRKPLNGSFPSTGTGLPNVEPSSCVPADGRFFNVFIIADMDAGSSSGGDSCHRCIGSGAYKGFGINWGVAPFAVL